MINAKNSLYGEQFARTGYWERVCNYSFDTISGERPHVIIQCFASRFRNCK